jgi:AraC-like DNA-binding protein
VDAGQVVIIPPGSPHSYGADPDNPWTLWWVHLAGAHLSDFLSAAGITASAHVRHVSDSFRAVALVEEIVRWMDKDSTQGSLVSAAGAAWHLLALLATDQPTADARSSVIEKARDYLRNHLDERVSLADLAAMASMSTSHFSVLFRRQIGFPVLKYQTQLRMARARELLDTSDRPVSVIAHLVGYDDPFYFSRQFRAVHRATPLQYRAQRKG